MTCSVLGSTTGAFLTPPVQDTDCKPFRRSKSSRADCPGKHGRADSHLLLRQVSGTETLWMKIEQMPVLRSSDELVPVGLP
jgi:hypothetical protein